MFLQNEVIKWACPSNIAIIKYWGKHGVQLPRNASISLTLSKARSETGLYYSPKVEEKSKIDFYLDEVLNESFANKIVSFFDDIIHLYPFVKNFDYVIKSHNTFPHSSGIASSASGMGALAMCIAELEVALGLSLKIDIQKASHAARIGSGSACRSLLPVAGLWGEHCDYTNSSDLHAISIADEVHNVFHTYHDDIVIVSAKEKSVSSRAGHGLMENNPFATVRYTLANNHMTSLKSILQNGDVDAFGTLLEQEAMTLHALMMCSAPSYILIEPKTIEVINLIRKYRAESKDPLYFTLDAGPNVHMLYPHSYAERIKSFIQSEIKPLAQSGLIIEDQVGEGPVKF
jgi:diphosphomevalonate decarboxylase